MPAEPRQIAREASSTPSNLAKWFGRASYERIVYEPVIFTGLYHEIHEQKLTNGQGLQKESQVAYYRQRSQQLSARYGRETKSGRATSSISPIFRYMNAKMLLYLI